MDVVCVRIAGIEHITSINEYMFYLKFLSLEKCERLSRYTRKEDFIRSLVAEFLVRILLVKQSNLSNPDIRIALNAYGKPYLEGGTVEFNVSHSGEWVVAVVGQSSVGIDVEQIKPVGMGIAKRFFTEKEYKEIASKEVKEQNRHFFDLWTLKESYIKACGQGLSIPLNLFSFSVDGKEISFENNHSQERYYFQQYQIHNQYKLAVCSLDEDFPPRVIIWSLDQLLDTVKQLLHQIS